MQIGKQPYGINVCTQWGQSQNSIPVFKGMTIYKTSGEGNHTITFTKYKYNK